MVNELATRFRPCTYFLEAVKWSNIFTCQRILYCTTLKYLCCKKSKVNWLPYLCVMIVLRAFKMLHLKKFHGELRKCVHPRNKIIVKNVKLENERKAELFPRRIVWNFNLTFSIWAASSLLWISRFQRINKFLS